MIAFRALSLFGVLFLASLFSQSAAAEFVARHGMTSSSYQTYFDQYVGQGYRLAQVDAYQTNSGVRYAAIWDRQNSSAWVARHGMSASSYQTYFDQYTAQSYRPLDISATAAGSGSGTFAAVWNQSSGSWVARHGLTSAQYQSAFDNFVGQGYQLIDVEGYSGQGGTRYAALWVQSNGNAWVSHHGMSSSSFQSRFDQYVGQGYRLTHVDGHWTASGVQYAAIWEKVGGAAWVAHHGMSSSSYQSKFNQYVGQGYELIHVSGYWDGGQELYAAIWSK